MKDLESDKTLQKIRKTFKFYVKHAVRRENEYILMKCQFFKQPGLECDYCKTNPPKCTQTLDFMKKFDGRFMQPINSSSHPGHYMTFLEMAKLDKFQSEQGRGDLGKCKICPNWGFSTITEQDRHRKLFHPKTKVNDVVPETSQIHTCNFKINGKVCGEIFSSHHLLWKHKTNVGHKKNRIERAKKQVQEEADKSTKQKAEKTIAKKVAKQKCITNCFVLSQEELEETEKEEGNSNIDMEDNAQISIEEEEVDDDDCNARPCKIEKVIEKSNQTVEWVQCRLCPKWFHQYCVEVNDTNARMFECALH